MPDVKLVAGDTMNYWIKDHRPALLEVLRGLDMLLINDTEARDAGGQHQPGAGGEGGAGDGAACWW